MNETNKDFTGLTVNIISKEGYNKLATKNTNEFYCVYGDTETDLETKILNTIYPPGAIYMSVTESKMPEKIAALGTWEPIEGKFLIGANDTYPANTMGGKASVTLTTSNLPTHTHKINNAGEHSHDMGGKIWSGGPGVSGNSDWAYVTSANREQVNRVTGKSGTHNHTMSSVGKEKPDSLKIIPPYLAVYMWQRTA